MLLNSSNLLGYFSLYRVLWISGRYGGGKTSLAFRLAYEMVKKKKYRYVVSNVKSVWSDDPAKIELRDGIYADAVVILDEGGIFLKTGRDTDAFLAFLRKLNIAIIIPSVQPPATRVRSLSVQRTMNLNVYGLPVWFYNLYLDAGKVKEKDWFMWLNPHEIYGIYDTLGMPIDDGGLHENMQNWIAQAASKTGYKNTAKRLSGENVILSGFGEGSEVDHLGRLVEDFEAASIRAEEVAISLHEAGKRGRKRRN